MIIRPGGLAIWSSFLDRRKLSREKVATIAWNYWFRLWIDRINWHVSHCKWSEFYNTLSEIKCINYIDDYDYKSIKEIFNVELIIYYIEHHTECII